MEFTCFIVPQPQKKEKNANLKRLPRIRSITPIEAAILKPLPSPEIIMTPAQRLKALNRRALSNHVMLKQRAAIRFSFSVRPLVKKKRIAWLTRRWWWLCPRRWISVDTLSFRPNFKIRLFSRGGSSTRVKGFEPRWFFKRYTRSSRHPNLHSYRRLSFFRRPPIVSDKSADYKRELDLEDFTNKFRGDLVDPRSSNILRRPRAWAFIVAGSAFRNGQLQLDPYRSKTKDIPSHRVSRVCLVQGNRNFWGILHYRNKMVTHASAGQMPDSAGSLRCEPAAIHGVARIVARSLRAVLQGVSEKHFSRLDLRRPRRRKHRVLNRAYKIPAYIARRYRKRWTPQWLKTTREQRCRPNFHLSIKLKNYQPYKQVWWSRLIDFVLKNAAFKKRGVNLIVTVETVVLRPHNGLRPRKPTRQ